MIRYDYKDNLYFRLICQSNVVPLMDTKHLFTNNRLNSEKLGRTNDEVSPAFLYARCQTGFRYDIVEDGKVNSRNYSQAFRVPPITGVIPNLFIEDLERIWSQRDVIPDPYISHSE